ncbi:transposase family protein [Nostoc sp. NMS4]|nr:transposase family protein [Nostoc sp. NMS4]
MTTFQLLGIQFGVSESTANHTFRLNPKKYKQVILTR